MENRHLTKIMKFTKARGNSPTAEAKNLRQREFPQPNLNQPAFAACHPYSTGFKGKRKPDLTKNFILRKL